MADAARSIAHLCDMFNFECDVASEILRQCGNRLTDAIALAAELEQTGGETQVVSPPDNPWEFRPVEPLSKPQLYIPDYWLDWWNRNQYFYPNLKRRVAEELLFSGNDELIYMTDVEGGLEIDRRLDGMFGRRVVGKKTR